MATIGGNDLDIAISETGERLVLSADDRSQHVYVSGTTRSGKSKLLEHMIRQDVDQWRESKSGMLLLDWHGPIYDGVMNWLSDNTLLYGSRPIVPIDLRRDDWIVGYNILRARQDVDPSVLVSSLVDQVAHVWEQSNTSGTPRFGRVATSIFQSLYEGKLTFDQALTLLKFDQKEFRATLAAQVEDRATREELEHLNSHKTEEKFFAETESTYSRFLALVKNKLLMTMFGQPKVSFDFGNALEQGQIILVCLSGEGGKLSLENRRTFASLMLGDLWAAAQIRGKRDAVKPFYVYLDEFQNFVSPTIASSLDEAAGFGIHMTMAHQYPSQLIEASKEHGQRLYDSIMNNAKNKITFSVTQRDRNLTPLAEWFFLDTWDLNKPKYEHKMRMVVDFKEEKRTIRGKSRGHGEYSQSGSGRGTGAMSGAGASFSGIVDASGNAIPATQWVESQHQATSSHDSETDSYGTSDNETESETEVPMLVPQFGYQTTAVQFNTPADFLLDSEQRIRRLKNRFAIARFVGMDGPVSLRTPEVTTEEVPSKRLEGYRLACLQKLPFALPLDQALDQLKQAAVNARHEYVLGEDLEPKRTGRKIAARATVGKHGDVKDDT